MKIKDSEKAIYLEKQRRQCGKSLKNYLFDLTDSNEAVVFSPRNFAQTRERKAEMEAQQQEVTLQKAIEKADRQEKAMEKKA